jgi:hypothetical protein
MLFVPPNYAPLSFLNGATKNLLRSRPPRMAGGTSFYFSSTFLFQCARFKTTAYGGGNVLKAMP